MARSRRKSVSVRSVIKNYGLMWRRELVHWNQSGPNGSLNGRLSGRQIDFGRQIGVYVLYDESRRPIYIGQTGSGKKRLFARLRDHTRDRLSLRWRYFSWFGLRAVNKGQKNPLSQWDDADKRVTGTIRSTLNEIEGVLIAATEPAFNKQGARFRGISRYRQVPDVRAGDEITKQLRELAGATAEQSKSVDEINEKIDKLLRTVMNKG